MTNFNIELEFPAAPFQRRFGAWVLDSVFLIIFGRVFGEIIGAMDGNDVHPNIILVTFLLMLLFFLTYHLICEVTMNGQSLGKKIVGIRVVNERGGHPTLGQFLIRWVIRSSDLTILSFLYFVIEMERTNGQIVAGWIFFTPLLLFIADVILVVSSKKQQRLGDMLAHTILIRTTENYSIRDTVFLEIEDNYVPSFPQVMQLTDRDINSIKSILERARKKDDLKLAAMAAEKVKTFLKIDTHLHPVEFLKVLLKDYNYLSRQ